ncbi:M12 family metallo-peptidase [Marinicella meishanensis]|uniref:M12 family metallo-peptidase n=1 Tax=Marinicella meishanensis TaxID=2873263 RepID=UPI001CBF23A1|nr:M12 family metallo-peptidase [Marinicella sp. NBU2979]
MKLRLLISIHCLLWSLQVSANTAPKTDPVQPLHLNTHQISVQAKQRSVAVAQRWQPSKHTVSQLLTTPMDATVNIQSFPDVIRDVADAVHLKSHQAVGLTRYEIMAPGAKITALTDQGTVTLPPPNLLVYGDTAQGVSLVVNPNNGDVSGLINQAGVTMAITGNLHQGIDFQPTDSGVPTDQASQQCQTALADQPGDPLADLQVDLMSQTLSPSPRGALDYQAVVAVDTDNEWMAGKGNNTTTATNYIVGLFSDMNVFYERDLSLRLLIGNVNLRIAADPFPTRSDIFDSLNDFGEYWRVNNDAISRDFVVLLSGQNIANFSFSGIAWINQYCENGFLQAGGTETVGSYSVNRIGSSLSTGFTAQFVGHELGHNMGSPHTHCYVPAVDQCFNGEGGCYGGAVSCPGGSAGTIMSYCHFGAPNGADCGLNDDEFHPTVITLLDTRIVSNFPSCIEPLSADLIFANSFD